MLRLQIETTNAALAGGEGAFELSRLLRAVAVLVEDGEVAASLLDFNGNKVGWFLIEGDWMTNPTKGV